MAQDIQINISLKLIENINKNIEEINANLKKLDGFKFPSLSNAITALSTSFLAVTKALSIVYDGFTKIVDIMGDAISQAIEQEKAESMLASALRQKGILTDELLRKNLEYAQSLQQITVYEDDQIIRAQTILYQLGVQADAIENVTGAILDYASATGTDLQTAAEQVGRAIIGSTDSVGRLDLGLKNITDTTERAAVAVKTLSGYFGGSAQAEANTFGGAIKQLENKWNDLLKAFGEYIVKNPIVIEAFKIIGAALNEATKYVQTNKKGMSELVKSGILFLIDALKFLIDTLHETIVSIGKFFGKFEDNSDKIKKVEKQIEIYEQALLSASDAQDTFQGRLISQDTDKAREKLKELNDELVRLKAENKDKGQVPFLAKASEKLDEIKNKVQDLSSKKLNIGASVNAEIKANVKADTFDLEKSFKKLGDIISGGEFKDKVFKGFVQSGRAGAVAISSAAVTAIATAFGGPEIAKYAGPIFELFAKPAEEFKKSMKEFFQFFKEIGPLLSENLVVFIDEFISAIPAIVEGINQAIPLLIERLAVLMEDPAFWERVINAYIAVMSLQMSNPEIWKGMSAAIGAAMLSIMIAAATAFARRVIEEIRGKFEFIAEAGAIFVNGVTEFAAWITNFGNYVSVFNDVVKKIGEVVGKIGGGVSGIVGGGGGGGIGGVVGSIGKKFGFAEGVDVPNIGKYKGDNFPAMLDAGEAVLTNSTTTKLNDFLDRVSTGVQTPINIILQVNEQELSRTLVNLNQKGFRLA